MTGQNELTRVEVEVASLTMIHMQAGNSATRRVPNGRSGSGPKQQGQRVFPFNLHCSRSCMATTMESVSQPGPFTSLLGRQSCPSLGETAANAGGMA